VVSGVVWGCYCVRNGSGSAEKVDECKPLPEGLPRLQQDYRRLVRPEGLRRRLHGGWGRVTARRVAIGKGRQTGTTAVRGGAVQVDSIKTRVESAYGFSA